MSFDIDANGILNVSAKDKATNKEQSIVIKASSGLSEDEIETMVRDAEAHEAEDQKFEEMVGLRNQADGLVHAARKMVTEAGDKATDEEKEKIESAAKALEEAIKGSEKEPIESGIAALSEATGSLAQKMYAEAGPEGAAPDMGDGAQGAGGHAGPEAGPKDDAVDAEFEEVKDDDKR